MKHILLSIVFLFLANAASFAQEVTNVRFEQSGKQVIIYYDLAGKAGSTYKVEIYYSSNGNKTWGNSLKMLTGEAGDAIKSGINKKAIWNVLAEREKLEGEICFKVTATDSEKSGKFTDARDGTKYKWVRIGTLLWMTENLNYVSIGGNWCFLDDNSNCTAYGRLYNWEAANIACPVGWHLPTNDEWKILIDYLGGESIAGGKMKEVGTKHWNKPNTGATDESGFNALPGGKRSYDGSYQDIESYGYWWSSTNSISGDPLFWCLHNSSVNIFNYNFSKSYGFSVRCVKDK